MMFKVEVKQINTIKPWMILGNNDWPTLLGAIISILIMLWGTIVSFLHRNWFSFACLAVAFLLFIWIVPKFLKVRRIIISKFGSDDWTKEIHFTDNEIVVVETGSKGVYTERRRYAEIADILMKENYITLKMSTLPHITFHCNEFSFGSWEECRQYIEGKRRNV